MEAKTAVLLGATGLIGNHLLELLLSDDYFSKIIALVRRPLPVNHSKLETKITDFQNKDQFRQNLGKGDIIFCCIGTTIKKVKGDKDLFREIDFDIPVEAARWGVENGFSQYLLVSSVGANARSSNFYLQLKGSVEDALRLLPYPALHIFRPSFLLGFREEKRWGEKTIQTLAKAFAFLLRGSLKRYRAIPAAHVAAAMVAAVKSATTGIHIYEFEEMNQLIEKQIS